MKGFERQRDTQNEKETENRSQWYTNEGKEGKIEKTKW